MTRYEELINKANACRQAAFRTEGTMREIWLIKAFHLEMLAANLPLNRAEHIISWK